MLAWISICLLVFFGETLACGRGPRSQRRGPVAATQLGSGTNSLQSQTYTGPARPVEQVQFKESAQVINNIIGPFKDENIVTLRGGGLAVEKDTDLQCSFAHRCCWHNIAGGNDDLEWGVALESPDYIKASRQFGTARAPVAPFAVTGAKKTHSFVYSFIVSCPILCQQEAGLLSLDHWTTDGVIMDVCTLPLDSRNFSYCHTVRDSNSIQAKVEIPGSSEPFVIVIVASEFTKSPGGVAAIDNINYSAFVCNNFEAEKSGVADTNVDRLGLQPINSIPGPSIIPKPQPAVPNPFTDTNIDINSNKLPLAPEREYEEEFPEDEYEDFINPWTDEPQPDPLPSVPAQAKPVRIFPAVPPQKPESPLFIQPRHPPREIESPPLFIAPVTPPPVIESEPPFLPELKPPRVPLGPFIPPPISSEKTLVAEQTESTLDSEESEIAYEDYVEALVDTAEDSASSVEVNESPETEHESTLTSIATEDNPTDSADENPSAPVDSLSASTGSSDEEKVRNQQIQEYLNAEFQQKQAQRASLSEGPIQFSQFQDACSALSCNFQKKGVTSLCGYQQVADLDTVIVPFKQRTMRLGNYAAGVPFMHVGRAYYLGAELPTGSVAAIQSLSFDLTRSLIVRFRFFEAAAEVLMRVCYDDLNDPMKCTVLSQLGVAGDERRWRSGRLLIPPGFERKLFLIAENVGENRASVGVDSIQLFTSDQRRIDCTRRFIRN